MIQILAPLQFLQAKAGKYCFFFGGELGEFGNSSKYLTFNLYYRKNGTQP